MRIKIFWWPDVLYFMLKKPKLEHQERNPGKIWPATGNKARKLITLIKISAMSYCVKSDDDLIVSIYCPEFFQNDFNNI